MIHPVVIETLGAVALVIAVIGVFLNNAKMRACFVVWWFSNSLGIFIHLAAATPLYTMALKDAGFLVLAIVGYFQWARPRLVCGDHNRTPENNDT